MKKTLIKIAQCFALILISVFFIPNISNAAVLDSFISSSRETVDDLGTAFSNSRDQVGWFYQPVASHYLCNVWIYVGKSGTPTDKLRVRVTSYPFGFATSTATSFLGTFDILASTDLSVGGSDTLKEYEFTPCVTVVGGSWYSITLLRTGDRDSTNYYTMLEDLPSPCGGSFVGTGYLMFARYLHDGSFIKYDDNHCGANLIINGEENFSAFQPPGATTIASTLSGDCSDEGFLSGSICYMYQYLFVPDSSMLDEWVDFIEIIKTKIPFSYFYEIYDSVSGQSTTGTSSPVTSLEFTASTTAVHLTYSPFSTSTALTYMGSTLYNFYQTMMRYAVLAGFGFYVFYRVKSLMETVK